MVQMLLKARAGLRYIEREAAGFATSRDCREVRSRAEYMHRRVTRQGGRKSIYIGVNDRNGAEEVSGMEASRCFYGATRSWTCFFFGERLKQKERPV